METKFDFNSQVCTSREQSERLLALGLNPETADCHWATFALFEDYEVLVPHIGGQDDEDDIPAWSLHRLLCLYGADYTIKEVYNNAEECYEMLICAIEIAIEDGDFPKEYLCER